MGNMNKSDVQKPNVILCVCDQLRAFEVGCYGNDVIRTPHIDDLAANGVRFEVAVTSNPVCMAARSGILSGQHSRSCNGHLENDYVDTGGKGLSVIEPEFPERNRGAHLPGTSLAEAFATGGYRTATIGKWHIRPAPEVVGFDLSVLPLNNHRHTQQQFAIDGAAPVAIGGFSVEREIEQVETFLAQAAASTAPFFLYYNIMPPHMPLGDMPQRYLDMHLPADVPLRPNVERDGQLPHSEEWFRIYLWDYAYYHYREPHTLELPLGFGLRELMALYYGAVSWVDDTVGRMLRSLESNGLAGDTIVVFTSDHGDNLGSHHRWNKGLLLEESIRIPMLYWFPKRWPAEVNRDQVASTLDIMPTVLHACGLDLPNSLQGQSLLPLLDGVCASLERDWSFVETSDSNAGESLTEIGIRTPSHLYGMCLDAQSHELVDADYCFFDLEQDPYELDNIVGCGRTSGLEGELKRRLLDWNEQTVWHADPDAGPDRTHLFDANGMPR